MMFESRPERNEEQANGLFGGEGEGGGGGSGSGNIETSRHLRKGLGKSRLFIDFFPFLPDIHVRHSVIGTHFQRWAYGI